ncbi:hypothetical protein [Deinococcus sp.]|uniref:hypothetical protein n=1 Tax=Deinococcus sp. TaxID=47478 RepID=UPI002869ABA0|nr:hypothetical protein [Deinococcus sp.]
MTPVVETPAPRLTREQLRLLILVTLLALAAGILIGYRILTVQELAGQAVQALIGTAAGLAALGSRK